MSADTGRWVVCSLEKRGARIYLNTQLRSAENGHVVLSTGEEFDSGLIVWTAGNAANPIIARHTVPNAQHAVRQAKRLASNILATIRGRGAKNYVHHNLGVVATLGLGQGVFQSGRIVIKGFAAWVMHRGYHVLAIPSWERKIRILAVWFTADVFGRDTVSLTSVQHPRDAFVAGGARQSTISPPIGHNDDPPRAMPLGLRMIGAAGDTDRGPDGQADLVEHLVVRLRERLYGAISGLATLAVLARYTSADTNAWTRVVDVAFATGGLWAASLLADWVAHLGVHRRAPLGQTALRTLRSSGQILEAALVPLLVLVVSGIGWLPTDTAMWIAMWVLVAELGIIAFLAVRRAHLHWWQKIFAVTALAGVGALVVAVKMLAH